MEFKKIRNRLSFWSFLIALIPLSIVISVIYVQRVDAIKKEVFSRLMATRDLKVLQVQNWLKERRGDINLLAINPRLRQLCHITEAEEFNRQDPGRAVEARNALNELILNYEVYSELFLISAQTGKIVVSSREELEGEDKSENTYFTTPMRTQRLFIKDIYYSKNMNIPALTFSAPVFSPCNNDEVTGIVVARTDLNQSLYALLLNRSGMGNTGETFIVNKDVVVLNELHWHENAPLNLKIDSRPAVQASLGRSGIVESEDYLGEMVLAAYTYIPDPGWGFVAKQNMDEIYNPIRELLKNCLLIYAVSAVVVYFISLLVARNIAKPLASLVTAVEQLEKGDLSVRSSFQRVDEIGRLSSAFDTMAGALASRISIQTSITEIMTLVVEAGKIEAFADNLLQKMMCLISSELGSFFLLELDKEKIVPVISRGFKKDLLEPIDNTKLEEELGRTIELGRINHIKDISVDTFSQFKMLAGGVLPKEIITVPLILKGKTKAVLSFGTMGCYTPGHFEIIDNVLPTLKTGLSSLLVNERTKELADNLKNINRKLELKRRELIHTSDDLQKQNIDLVAQRKNVEERTQELKVRVDEAEQLNKAMINLLEDLQDNQKQLESTSQQLAYSNRELEGFSYSVSHDLRAPLRHMIGFTSLLEKHAAGSFDDKSRHYVNIIKSSSEKMGQLIDDLLHYSRTGRAEMQKQMVDSQELVHEVIKELEKYDKGRQIEWLVGQLPPILADHSLLRIVWTNFLSNAVKFTGNREKARIEIGSRPGEKDETVYFIKDNGAGYDMRYKDKLFGVFQRLHRDSEFAGTGIGLAMVQRIIYRHGGRVWSEGVVDEGAIFFFALPKEV